MASLLKHADYAHRIVGPVMGLVIAEAAHRELDDPLIGEVHRIDTRLVILAVSYHRIGAERNRAREDVSAVVVRMFADQIDPARRKENADALCVSECLLKSEICLLCLL